MAKDKFNYFDAFIKQTEIALSEAKLLQKQIDEFTNALEMHDTLEEVHALEHKGDMLTHEVCDAVAVDFITPFEREDIIALAQCLDDISDQIEDVLQSFYMFDVHVMREDALEFARIIVESCEALNEAAIEFANYKKSTLLKEKIIKCNDCEEEGDRVYQRSMRKLYTEEREVPMRVQVWSQLYYRLEKATDSCEHAADVMSSVVLKNS